MTILSRTLKLGSYLVLCFVLPALAGANDWTERPYHAFGLADKGHDLRTEKGKDGVREIHTTGSDPYLGTVGLTEKIDPFTPYRVMFQSRSATDLKNFQVLYLTPGGLRHLNQDASKFELRLERRELKLAPVVIDEDDCCAVD